MHDRSIISVTKVAEVSNKFSFGKLTKYTDPHGGNRIVRLLSNALNFSRHRHNYTRECIFDISFQNFVEFENMVGEGLKSPLTTSVLLQP